MEDFWRGRRVLVTGATGLLGGWLTKRLLADGADPVCVVRDWAPQSLFVNSGLAERVSVARGDIRDQEFMERVLGEHEVETVFHLAAQTIVPIANRNPVSTFESNIRGGWATLEACRRSSLVRQVVVASSDKAYGECEQVAYDESTPLRGRHPYDASKACIDIIAHSYAATYGLPVAITRCGNFFGGGDLNWNRLVPGTIRSVLDGRRPVIRSDGAYVRDYLFVENAVSACISLARALAERPEISGEAFNFGHNRPLTVLEVVRKILLLCKREDLEPEIRGEASGEILRQCLDSSKARRVLSWEPRYTLEEGLGLTIDWYRDFLAQPR